MVTYGYSEWKRQQMVRERDASIIKELVDQLRFLKNEMTMGELCITKEEYAEIERLIKEYE